MVTGYVVTSNAQKRVKPREVVGHAKRLTGGLVFIVLFRGWDTQLPGKLKRPKESNPVRS